MVPDPDDADRPDSDDADRPDSDDADRPDSDDADRPDPDEGGTSLPVSRRTLLAGGALGVAGVAGAAALFGGGREGSTDGDTEPSGGGGDPTARRTTPVEGNEARRLAERFAPTIYFGRRERWFPTDPRPYTSEVDDETVVDGFDALDGYTAARAAADTAAPEPTVFYHVLEYTDRLAVVQYWLYSAFDQFSVNFHWHDWELLQAFVDREADEPVLYVASAHSRTVPNNEYIEPGTTPAIISEVGSHSSALGMNERRDTFQRLPVDDLAPDVTNGVLAVVSGEDGLPLAYGLPRDEGFRLPYVVPELDGAPLSDHPDLPNVSAGDLVPDDLTVRSFADLSRPPTALPLRERGPVFEAEHRDTTADETYALVPTAELEDIAAFTGPQLSFEFRIPGFVEDAVASHITTTDPPWDQPRYRDPLQDVTDDDHRQSIRQRFDIDAGDRGATVVGRLREVRPSDDPDVGVTLTTPSVEAVARLASDPVAVPTSGGVAAFVDVESGDHTLVVNGPGYAPYAQQVRVGDGGSGTTETTTGSEPSTTDAGTTATTDRETTDPADTTDATATTRDAVRVGTGGRVGVVPAADAVKLNVDAADRGGARRVRVADDAAGRVYDAPPVETDGRAGVYVHRAGGYVVEVTDSRGETSVERVNPGPNQNAAEVAKARTGATGITGFLVDHLTETRKTVRRLLRRGSGTSDTGDRTDGDSDGERSPTADATTTPAPTESEEPAEPTTSTATTTESDGNETTTEPDGDETATEAGGSGAKAVADRLRASLDEAVSRAETANEAALAGDDPAAVEALRALREVLERLSSLTERDDAPQPAGRITRRRIETADRRAARALSTLS